MHLYILIFWKGKTKNKFAETKRFLMWKTRYYHAANDCLITVENCIFKTSLPFFKVFYQRLSHRANITAKQNHCRRQYHASGISLPKATRFPFREMRRTLHFWNRIVGGGNAHSFACVRLFLHASTKVSCVGFIIWFPSGGLPRDARNDIVLRTQNNICSDYPPLKTARIWWDCVFLGGFWKS